MTVMSGADCGLWDCVREFAGMNRTWDDKREKGAERMSGKILVAYATRTGTTKSVAEFIGEMLCKRGAAVEVTDVKSAGDAAQYRAAVLGSAIRAGKLMPEMLAFVEANQEQLEEMPLAAFIVCATLQEDTEEKRHEAAAYLDPLRALVEPDMEGFFAGAIDRSKLSLPLRLILRAMKAEDGDWRDWDAIRAWTARLPEGLKLGGFDERSG